MPSLTCERLRETGVGILAAAGVPVAVARAVVEQLVEAELVGHKEHGIANIPSYIARLAQGEISPGNRGRIAQETSVSIVLDGEMGFAQEVVARAADMGMERAAELGIAAVAVRRVSPIARPGGYVERIARQGMLGLMFVDRPDGEMPVIPWGGMEGRLGMNPLAVGVPGGSGEPLVLDMTTGADTAVEGILPFGGSMGHKGYALNVAIALLAGGLSGDGGGGGVLLLIIDPGHFVAPEEFAAQVDELVGFVKSSPVAEGFDEVLAPGERESRERERRRIEGIEVAEEIWEEILACGHSVGWKEGNS